MSGGAPRRTPGGDGPGAGRLCPAALASAKRERPGIGAHGHQAHRLHGQHHRQREDDLRPCPARGRRRSARAASSGSSMNGIGKLLRPVRRCARSPGQMVTTRRPRPQVDAQRLQQVDLGRLGGAVGLGLRQAAVAGDRRHPAIGPARRRRMSGSTASTPCTMPITLVSAAGERPRSRTPDVDCAPVPGVQDGQVEAPARPGPRRPRRMAVQVGDVGGHRQQRPVRRRTLSSASARRALIAATAAPRRRARGRAPRRSRSRRRSPRRPSRPDLTQASRVSQPAARRQRAGREAGLAVGEVELPHPHEAVVEAERADPSAPARKRSPPQRAASARSAADLASGGDAQPGVRRPGPRRPPPGGDQAAREDVLVDPAVARGGWPGSARGAW